MGCTKGSWHVQPYCIYENVDRKGFIIVKDDVDIFGSLFEICLAIIYLWRHLLSLTASAIQMVSYPNKCNFHISWHLHCAIRHHTICTYTVTHMDILIQPNCNKLDVVLLPKTRCQDVLPGFNHWCMNITYTAL